MSDCEVYVKASKLISGSDVQSKLQSVINIIEEALELKTSRAKPAQDCEIQDFVTLRPIMNLKASEDVVEIPLDKLSKIVGYYDETICSSYCSKTGKIFLVAGKWCFSHLIHEALHSRSVFSQERFCEKSTRFVTEGLTELLVGLTLMEKIPDCYRVWCTNSCFSSDYITFVKPWYYLTFKTDFVQLISLYFDIDQQNPFQKMGKILQNKVDKTIQYIFAKYQTYGTLFFAKFLDELGAIFPKDFAEFQSLSPIRFELDHLKKAK